MKAITRKNLVSILLALTFLCVAICALTITTANAYAETSQLPISIKGVTTGAKYNSGDFTNERVTIALIDSHYSRIYFKVPNASSFAYTKSKSYNTGIANGLYQFYLATEEGERTQEFSIFYDSKPPVCMLYSNGQVIQDGYYAYENLTFSAVDEGSGVSKLFYKTPSSEIYKEYLPETIISTNDEDGWYSFYAVDKCQNKSESMSIFFKSDENAISGRWISQGNEIENNGYTNKPTSFVFDETEYTARFSFNGNDYSAYSNGQMFVEDGSYTVILTNLEQQEFRFTIHIDTIPPTGQLYANYLPVENNQHTKEKVYFTWDGNATSTVNGVHYEKNTVINKDGVYIFVLTDLAGNRTEYTITIDTVAPNHNLNKLNKLQKNISKWYVVDINDKSYSFATYDEALAFACEKEFAFEVTILNLNNVEDFNQRHLVAGNTEIRTGEYWLYKSKANPDIFLYYFDRSLLNDVISYYAKEFVSAENYFEYDADNNFGITADSMSDNFYCLLEDSFVPFINDFVFDSVDSTIVFVELVDGSGTKIQLEYGRPINEQIELSGLYRITEIDAAKNETVYYGYFDSLAPNIVVSAKIYGDTEPMELEISQSGLQGIAAYYYEIFNIKEIKDADKWSVLTVENGRQKRYFTCGDELPCLTVGGEYTLVVYDRFNNSYKFIVYIVGNPASIYFNEDDNNATLNLTIALEHSFDTIVSLEIFRNGQLIDDISTDQLIYTFNEVGIYIVCLKDNFGRIVTAEYSFGIELDTVAPSLTLHGVENGGVTNNTVILDNLSEEAKVEVYKDGQLIEYELGQELSERGKYIVVVTDMANNVTTYEFTIARNLNAGSIVLIVLSVLIFVGVVVAIILMRELGIFRKMKTKKSDSKSVKKN